MDEASQTKGRAFQLYLRIDRDLQPIYDWIGKVPEGKRGREALFLLRMTYESVSPDDRFWLRPSIQPDCPEVLSLRVRIYPDMGEIYRQLVALPARARARAALQRLREFHVAKTATRRTDPVVLAKTADIDAKRPATAMVGPRILEDVSTLDGFPGVDF